MRLPEGVGLFKRRNIVTLLLLLCFASVAVSHANAAASPVVIYIRANGSVEPSSASIERNGNFYVFTDDVYGYIIVERDGVTIEGNGRRLWGSGSGYGIELSGRKSVAVQNVGIESFRIGIWLNGSSNNIVSGNNVTANAVCGIMLYNHSDGNTISRNTARANFDAIYLHCSSGNTISENALSESGEEGIELSDSSDNIISGNNVTENIYDGIAIINSSSNNTVIENNVAHNVCGIWLYSYSDNNTVRRNSVKSNYRGICLESSSNNILQENSVTLNEYDGVALERASNSSLSRNSISRNYRGIEVYKSLNNEIHHNNVCNNSIQTSSYESINIWDSGYPSGGNYWSDYSSVDSRYGSHQNETGSDGIGDEGYEVDATNVDEYPLMSPIAVFETGTWDNVLYGVHIVSNSSVSDFHFNPEAKCITLNVTVESGTGFCRFSIPRSLLWTEDEWTILLDGKPMTSFLANQDKEYTYLYFTYDSSNKTVAIVGTEAIPSFPSNFILPAFMTSTLVATIVVEWRKRRAQQHRALA